tara:strand:+ start:202797 stop:204053 length:1257 start_codon:yes stop_codon:yes gene_type:complete
MTLAAWLAYLETLHPREIELGLERIKQVADKFNLDFSRQTVIAIGGTNGKGSTSSFLENLLADHAKHVGVYRSPHLLNYNERVCVDGKPVSDEALCLAFDKIEQARADISLSYFEFGTLAALLIFAERQVDYLLLEVGLGGRLDAVNIIDADLAIITNIALDHTEWLGDTREKIAYEKAGIMRKSKPVLFGDSDSPASVLQQAELIGARLYKAGSDFSYSQKASLWCWRGQDQAEKKIEIEIQSRHLTLLDMFPSNAALALQAFVLLESNYSVHMIERALNRTSVPGRFQILQRKSLVVLDVAHNPHAMAMLATNLKRCFPDKSIHILIAMLSTKDYKNSLQNLLPLADSWHVASLQNSRGSPAKILYNELQNSEQNQVKMYDSVKSAFHAAERQLQADDLLLVTGSFYTVAEVLELF